MTLEQRIKHLENTIKTWKPIIDAVKQGRVQLLGTPDDNARTYDRCLRDALRGNAKPLENFFKNGGTIPEGRGR